MKIESIKKIILVIVPAFILTGLLFLNYHYINEQKIAELRAVQQDAELAKLSSLKRAPASFDAEVAKFNSHFKKALIATRVRDGKESETALQSAIVAWGEIADYYRYNQPADYFKTEHWLEKINNIYELIIKAENFLPQE